jgi:hypothetical protein
MLDQGTVFGGKTPWDWHRDRSGRTCGYISVDATGIQMQGPDGAKAEGRMAYVGMIFNPQPRRDDDEAMAKPCDGVRYLAGLYKLDDLGMQLRRQAAQVGLNEVEQWIALTDAGNGLENFMDVNFPRAVKIVDFRHVTEYLSALSKLLSEGEAAADLLDGWCHRLKHAGGSKVLEELQGLDRGAMTAACRVEHDRVLTYFGNHVGRMNYPEYLRQGWQIGSGAVESACKRVINARLNMGGMRWGEEGGDALAHLRALWCSDADQWDTFWSMAA